MSQQSKWKVHSKCELYCDDDEQWIEGIVQKVYRFKKSEWIRVKYGSRMRDIRSTDPYLRDIRVQSTQKRQSREHQAELSSLKGFPLEQTFQEIAVEYERFHKEANYLLLGHSESDQTAIVDALIASHVNGQLVASETTKESEAGSTIPVQDAPLERQHLLIPLTALRVGVVISGDLFGWNDDLECGGFSFLIVATLLVGIIYVCVSLSLAALAAFSRKAFVAVLKANMIHSQYELDFAIVTEHTMKDIQDHAARNMKYFPVIKAEWGVDRVSYKTTTSSKAKEIYSRLAAFSRHKLDNIGYAVIGSHNALCFGFIRRFEKEQNIAIAPIICELINSYFFVKKLNIKCTKLKIGGTVCCLWQSTNTDWTMPFIDDTDWIYPGSKFIKGIIYTVDLSTFDQHFVDEKGRKHNKLEQALSEWEALSTKRNVPAMALLTKRKAFADRKRIKNFIDGPDMSASGKVNISRLDPSCLFMDFSCKKWMGRKLCFATDVHKALRAALQEMYRKAGCSRCDVYLKHNAQMRWKYDPRKYHRHESCRRCGESEAYCTHFRQGGRWDYYTYQCADPQCLYEWTENG